MLSMWRLRPISVRLLPTDKDESFVELDAIVVGAVGMGALWFVSGWAEGTELEFIIDTGCQVTILATLVFERMCVADPQFRGWLRRCRRCRRRVVSVNLSPLMVKLTVVTVY